NRTPIDITIKINDKKLNLNWNYVQRIANLNDEMGIIIF
ncbi:uncharacterized protein METZ01_LOCUS511968, partial [marine metagenome]